MILSSRNFGHLSSRPLAFLSWSIASVATGYLRRVGLDHSLEASTVRRPFLGRRPRHQLLASRLGSSIPTMESTEMDELRFVDIGANMLDERFQGIYRGSTRHVPDLHLALERAARAGVKHIVVTAGTLKESRAAVEFCRRWNSEATGIHFSCTVGVHPTRCQQEFVERVDNQQLSDEEIVQQLLEVALEGKEDGTVVAVGEMGLDYDRLEFCSKEVQRQYLIRQLKVLAKGAELPLFLHNRNVGSDLYDILVAHRECWTQGGVVHSFDDTVELASRFLSLGPQIYIGLNGCSLRTQDNLQTVAQLPLERLLLETDCPYCEVRKTHAGHSHIKTTFEAKAEKKFVRGLSVKNRQEPCHVIQVAEIVAGVKKTPLIQVASTIYENSLKLYGWDADADV